MDLLHFAILWAMTSHTRDLLCTSHLPEPPRLVKLSFDANRPMCCQQEDFSTFHYAVRTSDHARSAPSPPNTSEETLCVERQLPHPHYKKEEDTKM